MKYFILKNEILAWEWNLGLRMKYFILKNEILEIIFLIFFQHKARKRRINLHTSALVHSGGVVFFSSF